jgi:hypothetical protein
LGAGYFGLVDEFLEQRAVVNHGRTQIFGVGFSSGLTRGVLVRGAVIFENQRMVHGNIGGALFEIADGIAACRHHVAQQLVGAGYGAAGAVNEACLEFGPRFDEARAVAGASSLMRGFSTRAARAVRAASAFCWLPPSVTARVYSALPNGVRSFLRAGFAAGLPNGDECQYHHYYDSDGDNDLRGI